MGSSTERKRNGDGGEEDDRNKQKEGGTRMADRYLDVFKEDPADKCSCWRYKGNEDGDGRRRRMMGGEDGEEEVFGVAARQAEEPRHVFVARRMK